MQLLFNDEKLEVVKTPGDVSCLFHAIANVSRAIQKTRQQTPVGYAINTIPRDFCIWPSAGGAQAGPAGGTAGGGKRKRQVDADVLALLQEWELEDESEHLAKNGVCKMKDLESMPEKDRKEFGCRLSLRGLLHHVAKQKKRAPDGSKEHKVHYQDKTRAIG